MKTLIMSVVIFFSFSSVAVEVEKSQINLKEAVEKKNKEEEKKIKEFVKIAESKNDNEVVKALKADKDYRFVNVKIKEDHILTYCIKNKMWKSAEELVKGGSNLNHQDKDGKVALMWAAEAQNRYLTTLIIATNADKQIKDKNGVSAEEYLKKNNL